MRKMRRVRCTNASSVAEKLLNLCHHYSHHTHCLSLTQVTPGHVNEVLAMNVERVKPENPELKRGLIYLLCVNSITN